MPTQKRFNHFDFEIVGDVVVLTLYHTRILDDSTVASIKAELFEIIDDGNTKLVLDFTRVEYFSGQASAMLISVNKKINGVQGRWVIASVASALMEVFTIIQLPKFMTFSSDKATALTLFESS